MSTVLQTDALVKDYGNKIALAGINLNLESGKIIGLLGSNGSGKTTFLKLVAGILTPTGGKISVCGMPVGVETKKIYAMFLAWLLTFPCCFLLGYLLMVMVFV